MNRLIKNMFAVVAIALLISLAAAAMGSSCGLETSQVINADPNEPGDIPEMVPNYLSLNVISEDPNAEPAE